MYRIRAEQAQARHDGYIYWRRGTTPGANQEAYLTLTKLGAKATTQQGILLKLRAPGTYKASYIKVVAIAGGKVQVWTKAPNKAPYLKATFRASFIAGDQLAARAQSDGSVTVYKNGLKIGRTNVTRGTHPWSASLNRAGGRIGVIYFGVTSTRYATFDDFGGGTMQ
jgi:hypothetical protein